MPGRHNPRPHPVDTRPSLRQPHLLLQPPLRAARAGRGEPMTLPTSHQRAPLLGSTQNSVHRAEKQSRHVTCHRHGPTTWLRSASPGGGEGLAQAGGAPWSRAAPLPSENPAWMNEHVNLSFPRLPPGPRPERLASQEGPAPDDSLWLALRPPLAPSSADSTGQAGHTPRLSRSDRGQEGGQVATLKVTSSTEQQPQDTQARGRSEEAAAAERGPWEVAHAVHPDHLVL